ncbi:hypothetical protein RIEGSTA812A_PEG_86 [invertebrate metagenome]|uniref:Uncharacterized protein n=1 Tax=invertebrate metagenome TaxID=1711999 RepID=A0A484H7A4_9ZZZZ
MLGGFTSETFIRVLMCYDVRQALVLSQQRGSAFSVKMGCVRANGWTLEKPVPSRETTGSFSQV